MTTPIAYDLTCETRDDHVFARVRSISLTPDVATQFLRDARNKLIDSRQAHLLLEVEVAHALSDQEVFAFMDNFSGVLSGLRVALVNRDTKNHDNLQFGIRVSREAGEQYGYFTCPDEALNWLRLDY
ncbi:MAG TPA: hypothetical protein VL501_04380 [Pyrinomonadaceae bacterium]|nr:hypothetical protein [Pyrinomonadaceae bacterium]